MSKELVVTERDVAAEKSSMASVKKKMQQVIVLLALAALPMLSQAKATAVSPFITVWDLTKTGSAVAGSTTQLTFGVFVSGSVSYSWRYVVGGLATTGSGTIASGSITCTITGLSANATNFTLTIQPANFQRININGGTDRRRLVDISQWGSTAWTSMLNAFYGCANLGTITATDAPDLTLVTTMSQMFVDCTSFNGSIGNWNTVNVTIMAYMFGNCTSFNKDISTWNTANVTSMSGMFSNCTAFNQNISTWNTIKVIDISVIFHGAASFNQPIGTWNMANVTNMNGMFQDAAAFNQNISSWNTAKVTDMSFMFFSATAFNQDISSWNTIKVTDMSFMFYYAAAFNQNIGSWNVAIVSSMASMFTGATAFNQNIGSWNVATVNTMASMFTGATAFNQNIGNWNVANVTDMSGMFSGATTFNQSLGNWALKTTVNLTNMLSASGMDCANYTATLTGWAANASTPSGRSLGATGRTYGTNAVTSRYTLVSTKGWTISGDAASTGGCYRTATWTGITSINWGTATNWSTGTVPTIDYDVIIPAGTTNAPTVSTAQLINSLTVNTGATVSLGADLGVYGTLANSGTIAGSSTLVLSGTADQSITGIGTVANLEMNKNSSNSATISSGSSNKLNVTGTLTFTAGNFVTNGNLVLKSTVAGTARIAPITVAAPTRTLFVPLYAPSITGNITQERYIPAKTARTYTFVASPFRQTLAASWQQQVHITGPGTGGTVCPILTTNSNGFDATVTNAANMFLYVGAKAVNTRWTSIDGTSSMIGGGIGYRMNIRGPRSMGCSLLDGTPSGLVPAAVTLSSTGTLDPGSRNMGSFTVYYANNGDASSNNDNYLLVGNPYPSEISFSQLRADNSTRINNNYAIFAPGNTVGNYAYWNGTTWTGGNTGLSNATGNIIGNGQAFFVQGSTAGADIALNFNESQKTSTANNGNFRQQQNPDRVRIGYFLANGDKADEIMLQFAQQGTVSAMNAEDIVSMNNGTQTLKSVKGSRMMAINTRPFLQQDTIALNVTSTTDGNFKLTFSDFDDMANTNMYLIDHYSNTVQQMNNNPEYPFTVNKAIAATQGSQRFAVVFSRKVVPAITLVPNSSIHYYPNPVKDQLTVEIPASAGKTSIRLLDISGRALQQFTAKDLQTINMSKLATGTYLLEIINGKGERTMEKIIKQ